MSEMKSGFIKGFIKGFLISFLLCYAFLGAITLLIFDQILEIKKTNEKMMVYIQNRDLND